MKKVQSGEGATDFGQSTGLTQDELLGRAKSTEADSPQKVLKPPPGPMQGDMGPQHPQYPYGPNNPMSIVDALATSRQEREFFISAPPEPARSVADLREEIEKVIFTHWTASRDQIFPRWIGNAADVIVGLIS